MRTLDHAAVWLVVGVLALGGAIYLCAIDKLSGEVVATVFGVLVKGFVDALGSKSATA
jgi:hypothetical protein